MFKNNMKTHMNNSLRSKFTRILAAMIIILFVVAAISNISGYSILNESTELFSSHKILTEFYQNVDALGLYSQNYVYSNLNTDYENYRLYFESAQKNLEQIKKRSVKKETVIRFRFIENMLISYDELLQEDMEQLRESRTTKLQVYNDLKYNANLIENLYPQYSQLIYDDMQQRLKEIEAMWIMQFIAVVLIILLAMVFGVLVTRRMMNHIIKPINEMINNIQLIKDGEYSIKKARWTAGELEILQEAFSDMARSIRLHIQEIKEKATLEKQLVQKENENLKITNLLSETQLKVLQTQINPHFLFNTLSMLSKNAYIEGANDTSELMEDLSEILRYGLEKSAKISTIEDEIRIVKHYIKIQQKRLGNKAEFIVEVSDQLPQIKIPAMILQPLIENSIIHGIRNIKEISKIRLSIERVEDNLRVIIEDDGKGMPAEKLEEIETSLFDENIEFKSKKSIGILNVYSRLKLYFDKHFKFTIESEENCGTIITIVIPIEEQDGGINIV